MKNPAAQADDLSTPVNSNRENLGYSIAPVGDLGRCGTAVPVDPNGDPALGGDTCVNADSTGTPDGKPDIALSSHRSDDFGMFDVGVFMLLDGSQRVGALHLPPSRAAAGLAVRLLQLQPAGVRRLGPVHRA